MYVRGTAADLAIGTKSVEVKKMKELKALVQPMIENFVVQSMVDFTTLFISTDYMFYSNDPVRSIAHICASRIRASRFSLAADCPAVH